MQIAEQIFSVPVVHKKANIRGEKPFKIVLQKYLMCFMVLLRKMKTIFPYLTGILYFHRTCFISGISKTAYYGGEFLVLCGRIGIVEIYFICLKLFLNNFSVLFACTMCYLSGISCEKHTPNL